MYDAIFYSDSNGHKPLAEYIKQLRKKSRTRKDARINFTKIIAYIDLLCKHGTSIGEPVIKHLDDEIWELRPIDNRILFAHYKGKNYLLLHHFKKRRISYPRGNLNRQSAISKIISKGMVSNVRQLERF